MRSKADETFVIVETLICPLLIQFSFYLFSGTFSFSTFANMCSSSFSSLKHKEVKNKIKKIKRPYNQLTQWKVLPSEFLSPA